MYIIAFILAEENGVTFYANNIINKYYSLILNLVIKSSSTMMATPLDQ